MPQLTIQNLLDTLQQAAEDLRAAARSDGQLSRQDFNRLLEDKEGNERALLEALYRLLREEDRSNMRITRAVLDRSFQFIQDKIITQYALAPGGLSTQESDAIRALGDDTLAVAFQLKRAAQGAEYLTSMQIFEQLQELMPSLFSTTSAQKAAKKSKPCTFLPTSPTSRRSPFPKHSNSMPATRKMPSPVL